MQKQRLYQRVIYNRNDGPNGAYFWHSLLDNIDSASSAIIDMSGESDQKKAVMNTAKIFSQGLIEDIECYEQKQAITDCALACPALRGHYDKTYGLCSYIILIIFPKTDDTITDTDHVLKNSDRYIQLIKLFRIIYRDARKAYLKKEDIFRKVITNSGRSLYHELINEPISHHITDPDIKYIEPSNESEFIDLFEYLRTSDLSKIQNLEKPLRFKHGILSRRGTLDMCCQGMTDQILAKVLDILTTNTTSTNIRHLLFGNNIFGDAGAILLSNYLKNANHIESLYICACDISPVGLQQICTTINNNSNSNIKSLWLKRNRLGIHGMKILNEFLQYNKTVRTLDIINTGCLDSGCQILFDGLTNNTTIRTLYIGANGITSIGGSYVLDYYKIKIKTRQLGIESLHIDVNRLGDNGIVDLCLVLQNYNALRRLVIGANRITKPETVRTIYECFVNHQNLISLDVGACKSTTSLFELPNNIGDAGIEYIEKLISENTSIRVFNIKHNGISENGLKKLTEATKHNKSLFKIFIDQSGGKRNEYYVDECNRLTMPNIYQLPKCIETDPKDIIKYIIHGHDASLVHSDFLTEFVS